MQLTEQQLKLKVENLYQQNPLVHLNVLITKPKKTLLKNAPAKIVGVYSHFFQVEENSTGKTNLHTILYTDLAIKQVEIAELVL